MGAVPLEGVDPAVLRVGDLVLDLNCREVSLGGRSVSLTALEFDLLAHLASHPGWVFSPGQLLEQVWGHQWVADHRVVAVHVANLRRKLGETASAPRLIHTVRGAGYKLLPAIEPRDGGVPLPSAHGPPVGAVFEGRAAFVGRARERMRLLTAVRSAAGGAGGLVLICGELGIGKTRLAEETSVAAAREGLRVLWGRCQELEGVPAYWPWLQVLRSLVSRMPDDDLRREANGVALELGQLLPELRPRLGIAGEGSAGLGAQHRLFLAASHFMIRAARRRPQIVIVDDLQWADRASLGLLEVLAPQLADEPFLLVATVRDAEVPAGHQLQSTLGEVVRHGAERLDLTGLDADQVAEVVRGTTGVEAQSSVTGLLFRATMGNPFYLTELVRLLSAEDRLSGPLKLDPLPVPPTVQAVVSRRLARLSDGCRDLLGYCALAGRSFGLMLVERAAAMPREQVIALLDAALEAHLIEQDGSASRYRFSHPLVRETVVNELRHLRRLKLHAELARALAEEAERAASPSYVEVAHHFYLGASWDVAAEASHYCLLAGRQMLESFAYEAAEEHLSHALDACGLLSEPDDGLMCRILIRLGEAQKCSGKLDLGDETFARAVSLADRAGLVEESTRATLGFELMLFPPFPFDDRAVMLLGRAVDRLPDDEHPLMARCLASYARGIGQDLARRDEARGLLERAEGLARRNDDLESRAAVVVAKALVLATPDNLEERLSWACEASELSRSFGSRLLQSQALYAQAGFWWEGFWWEAADREEALRCARVCRHLADATRLPYVQWTASVSLAAVALQEGRPEEVLDNPLLFRRWTTAQGPMMDAALTFVEFYALRELSREHELEDRIRRILDWDPGDPGWSCRLAQVLIRRGRRDEARTMLDRVASSSSDFRTLPWDGRWLVFCALLAEVIHDVGDDRRAGQLYRLLLPYSDRVVVGYFQAFGSVEHYLGLLASTMGETESAERHCTRGLRVHEQLDMLLWRMHSQVSLAEAVGARRTREAKQRASALLEATINEAVPLGLARVVDRTQAARARIA